MHAARIPASEDPLSGRFSNIDFLKLQITGLYIGFIAVAKVLTALIFAGQADRDCFH